MAFRTPKFNDLDYPKQGNNTIEPKKWKIINNSKIYTI